MTKIRLFTTKPFLQMINLIKKQFQTYLKQVLDIAFLLYVVCLPLERALVEVFLGFMTDLLNVFWVF